MDQYLVAMLAVVTFALFAAIAMVRMIRNDNRIDRDPTERDGEPSIEDRVRKLF